MNAAFAKLATLASMLTLTACQSLSTHSTPNPPVANPKQPESLTIDSGECFGTCPVYHITLFPDGKVIFNGEKYTKTLGEKVVTIDPKLYQQTFNLIHPHLPELGKAVSDSNCEPKATDHPQYLIKWQVGGQTSELLHYTGCMYDHKELNQPLYNLPNTLGLTPFIE